MNLVKIDLGGGDKPQEGHINVDCLRIPGVDVVCDLTTLHPDGPNRLPFPDSSVDLVYSAHTMEHLRYFKGFLWEIARVCKPGASVEIRVPHPGHDMAMCCGHCHVISEVQVKHWTSSAISAWWQGSPKRLAYISTKHQPSAFYQEAQLLFPYLNEAQLFSFIRNTAWESQYHFEVIVNE